MIMWLLVIKKNVRRLKEKNDNQHLFSELETLKLRAVLGYVLRVFPNWPSYGEFQHNFFSICLILLDLILNFDTRNNNPSLYLLLLHYLLHLFHTQCCQTQHLPALASQSPSSSPSTACPKPCTTRKVLHRWRRQGWHSPFGFPLFVGIQRCCCRSSRCSWLFCSLEVKTISSESIFQ